MPGPVVREVMAAGCPHEYVETGKRQNGNRVTVYFRCVICGHVKTVNWTF